MARVTININPKFLKWAREEAGYSVSDISTKLGITEERYLEWETTGEKLPFGMLKKTANYYKRQIAAFMLQDIPKKLDKPKDYRNLNLVRSSLSKEVLLSMRRVNKLRNHALEDRGGKYWNAMYQWHDEQISRYSENQILAFLRKKLDVSIEDQKSFGADHAVYKTWRDAIEMKLGILVFQFPMPYEEVQGFCYSDFAPYCIVVNSKASYLSRVFTLFHELAHILRHESAICTPENVEESQRIEYLCNAFAGKFLLPKEYLKFADNLDLIKRYANEFKVSREVYLRRLFEEDIISGDLFFSLLSELKELYKQYKSKSTGFVAPVVKSKAQRGETFFNMVLDGVYENRVSYSYATELLGVKMKTLLSEL